MQIVLSRECPPELRAASLAIGNFDGLHLGHQALLAEAARNTKRRGHFGVVMFDPHPKQFFAPTVPHFHLMSRAQKLAGLREAGCSVAVILPFDATLAAMSPEQFMVDVLHVGLGVHHVVVGENFRFGARRAGTAEMLVERGAKLGFGVSCIQPITHGAEVVSSSAVRAALAAGNCTRAKALLGKSWCVAGLVHGGAKRGTGMGFPTANITLTAGTTLAHGIYAARVRVGGAVHVGAAYLGTRPTFDNGAPVLETFLLDFDGDLYGQTLEIAFIERIRPDQAFVSLEALERQMALDVARVRTIVAAADEAEA